MEITIVTASCVLETMHLFVVTRWELPLACRFLGETYPISIHRRPVRFEPPRLFFQTGNATIAELTQLPPLMSTLVRGRARIKAGGLGGAKKQGQNCQRMQHLSQSETFCEAVEPTTDHECADEVGHQASPLQIGGQSSFIA